jgi:hypothetical protein
LLKYDLAGEGESWVISGSGPALVLNIKLVVLWILRLVDAMLSEIFFGDVFTVGENPSWTKVSIPRFR